MKAILLLYFVLVSMACSAISVADAELAIASAHSRLVQVTSDTERDALCDTMRGLFISVFDNSETFDYPFSKFQFCKITSTDHRVRLFNWNLPYKDGTHKYFCFLLVWDDGSKNFSWTELKDSKREQEKIENKFLASDKWLGALYYEIIPMEKNGRGNTYTLLGWDGKDNMTTRKIIDAVTITGNKLRLGAGIYKSDDGTRKRMILEYSDEVSVSVKYYAKKECIVMDHLSPRNPLMQGIYADYGPDGTYDLLQLKRGKWEYVELIDISSFSGDDDKPYTDPRSGKRRK